MDGITAMIGIVACLALAGWVILRSLRKLKYTECSYSKKKARFNLNRAFWFLDITPIKLKNN
jgi:hypothetical protein